MLRKILEPWEKMPRFYGFAYKDYQRRGAAVCYLWPINHFVAALRWLWFKMRDFPFDVRRL
jgi:hypothetical protein